MPLIFFKDKVFREFPTIISGISPVYGKSHRYLCDVIKWINVKPINHTHMKKIVFLSLFALCLPWMVAAQSIDDDLYYVPSKDKKEKKQEKKVTATAPAEEIVVKSNAPTTVYTSPGNTTVVVQDRKGNTRDVDEYNRRYDSRENDFVMEDDTLYIKEKAVPDPEGEWVNGFEGSEDDYEYAMRIVRFRNPRYAVSISSPYYWDVMYGLNSWDWNVYSDGLYAYAFPTFSNRLWWDWRYNSYGWGGYPYYGWGGYSPYYGYGGWGIGWGGFYGGWSWGWGHHHHHHYPGGGWYPGGGGHWGGGHWEVAAYIQTDVTPVHVAQHLLCVHPVQIECPVRQET